MARASDGNSYKGEDQLNRVIKQAMDFLVDQITSSRLEIAMMTQTVGEALEMQKRTNELNEKNKNLRDEVNLLTIQLQGS